MVEFSVTVVENECITKDEDEWASLGCIVDKPNGTTVSGLGDIKPTTGYQFNITCAPIDGKNFSVPVLENECITKDEDEWASLGCIVDKSNGTTVSGLGDIKPTTGYQSCNITCPIDGKNFGVTVIENECITKDEDEWSGFRFA